MEHKGQVLADGHLGSFYHILHLCEGQLGLPVIKAVACSAGGDRTDHRLVVPEQALVVQIEVVVPDDTVPAEGVVKRGIQVDVLAIDFQNVPGVAVFDALFRIGFGDGDDAPHAQRVTENFHRLGDALAHADTLAQRTDDLMRVGLFQFVVPDILADEIMDVPLFFQRRHILRGTGQLFHPGRQSFLMVLDLALVKKIFRHQFHVVRSLVKAVGKAGDIEDLRAVQPQLEKNIAKFPILQP